MKIVFALPEINLSGGIKIVLEYAEYLHLQGHDVLCLYPLPARRTLRQWIRRLFSTQRRSQPIDRERSYLWQKNIPLRRCNSRYTLNATDFPDADIVVATWWQVAEWVSVLPPEKGMQFYFIQGHDVLPGLPAERIRATYRSDMRKIVVSQWLQHVLATEYQATGTTLVPNGVRLDRFHPCATRSDADFRIGHLWSSAPGKNSSMAIEAMLLARQQIPNIRGIIFGSGKKPELLANLDWIDYHQAPPQDQIPALYSQCHCWLFSSIAEGFGLPLLEAMASGTPVIATHAGAAPELVDATNGRLVATTAKAMASAICELARLSHAKWQMLSAASRKVAEAHDWTRSAQAFEAALLAPFAEPSAKVAAFERTSAGQ